MNLQFPDPVLLVEDTPSLSMVYQSALERTGLSVNPVFIAREARASFKNKASRIVLLDLMLPDGNGIDIETGHHLLTHGHRIADAHGDDDKHQQVGGDRVSREPVDDARMLLFH